MQKSVNRIWKNGRWAWVVGACVMFCVFSPLRGQAQDIKKVTVVNDPWPPYAIGNPGETPTGGMIVDLVNEIFKRLHIEVEFTLYPWERVLKLAKEGNRDCIAFAGKNAEREQWLAYTDPLYVDRQLLYYRADREKPFAWQTPEDFKGLKLGLTTGFNYGDELPKAIEALKLDVDYVKNDEQGFEKLLRGGFEVFICAEPAAEAIFKKTPRYQGKFKTVPKPYSEHISYMAFPKQVPAATLVPAVNRVLAELKADGTYAKLLNKYNQ